MSGSALSREKIFEIAQSLPPAPQVLAGLGTLLKDVNVNLDRVAETIRRDTALSAHLIRISNSVVYGGSGEVKVGTVEDAVGRVGFGEVYRLVGLATTARLTDRMLKYYNVPTEPLRANMLYTALVCEALAELSGIDPRMAYTAGLMRTLGIQVLDRIGDLLTGVEPYNHEQIGNYVAWEGRVFLFSNCEVAGMILSEWGFPDLTVGAVRDHYLLRDADYENPLACLLNVAGGIVAASGCALPGEYCYWETTPRKLQVLKLSNRQIGKASERARASFEAYRQHIDVGPLRQVVPQELPAEAPLLEKVRLLSSSRDPFGKRPPAASAVPDRPRKAAGSPWSFAQWPLVLRGAFMLFAAALAMAILYGSYVTSPRLFPALREFAAPLSHFHAAWVFVRELAATAVHSLPFSWLQVAATLYAVFCTAFFGIGAAAYRTLILNR